MPSNIINFIQLGKLFKHMETPKPNDTSFKNVHNVLVATNRDAISEACTHAKVLGYNTLMLSSTIEGETRDVAGVHAAIAREVLQSSHPISAPACLISGGETTVTLKGSGKGGRNQEFALAAAMGLSAEGNILIFSAGTDGTDGPTNAAGAICDSTTANRALNANMSIQTYLNNNDSYNFFYKLNDLIITGPTQTNVMDLRIVLIR